MRKIAFIIAILIASSAIQAYAQSGGRRLNLQHADKLEVILSKLQDTTFVIGSVIFETESGTIYCDSAFWMKEKRIKLKGRVILDDAEYHLAADSVDYDLLNNSATAAGDYVELWSRKDSLFAVGTVAHYNRTDKTFEMWRRPTVYLKYPDSSNMITVISDSVRYDGVIKRAEAIGHADITSGDLHATAGIATMFTAENRLELVNSPVASKEQSQIRGHRIQMFTEGNFLRRIEVYDSAGGEFNERSETDTSRIDRSILTGKNLVFDFDSGRLQTVTCSGQAYSWYLPSDKDREETNENTVSGDTITFRLRDNKLQVVDVQGGAVGSFVSVTHERKDTTVTEKRDTIDYRGQSISYALRDSLINLLRNCEVTSGDMTLDAHRVTFDTRRRLIEAFSAVPPPDTSVDTSSFAKRLQPNAIPVVLKDGADVLYGDYLTYAIDTRKGRILKSKSSYETGYFYGEDLYRQQEKVFYLDDGRYTTCDADEPHFHFYSKNLKLVENDRLIAKPVVLSIGRLPILAIPYYVFPLKKGRHSGILPFTLGNFERGDRYVKNVGYYWAASEYWDLQAALDYFDQNSTLNFYGRTTYAKRYVFNGTLSGNYTRLSRYDATTATEGGQIRWTIAGNHSHTFSPTFRVSANGSYQSDNSFYQDYSTDLQDRLNRVVRSQVSFSKRFGSYTISGNVTHDDDLDRQIRTDQIPSLTFSQVRLYPLGSGSIGTDGSMHRKFYNNLVATYTPGLLGYSTRTTKDTLVGVDTISISHRKKYVRVNHSLGVSMPLSVANHFTLSPNLSYSEVWYKVYKTDLSESAGIDPSRTYRAHAYTVGASLNTKVYGTFNRHFLGASALRQVLQPSISYGYTPAINHNPVVRSFAGGGPGSTTKSQSMTLGFQHYYQARIGSDQNTRTLELLSVSHSLSHNFEATGRKWSELATSFNSALLPKISFNGSLVHSFYRPGTNEFHLTKLYQQSFSMEARVALAGKTFLLDDAFAGVTKGVDSASQVGKKDKEPTGGESGWRMSASYSYSEGGRGSGFSKSSFLSLSVDFSLTPLTRVSYSQSFDVGKGRTVYNSVRMTRRLHCWSGELYWVPTGSTRGYGFRLYVTALPAIKIDNTQSTVSSSYLQNFRQ